MSDRDLRPYVDPPFDERAARRHLDAGRARLRRFRRRQAVGALALAVAGTAVAASLPRWWRPSTEKGVAQVTAPADDARSAAPLLRPTPAATGAPLDTVEARPADALADSVGVHVRLWYAAYDGGNYKRVKRRLTELGVRHVYDVSKTRLDRLRELGALGMKVHVLIREDGDPEAVARAVGPALASIQTDWRFGEEYRQGLLDEGWAGKARAFARDLHDRVRRSPLLEAVTLIGPSVRFPYETALVGDLSGFAEVGALNYWPAPLPPGGRELDEELAGQRRVFGALPLAITQTGYTTAPLALQHVSEAVQARYLLRLHLETFARGVVRTFANQLVDFSKDPSAIDAGLGLLRQDTSPKPSFAALKTFLEAFADPGAPAPPTSLRLALDGPPDVRRSLFVRRDGTFILAVWLPRAAAEQPTPQPALLRLASPMKVRIVDPHGIAAPRELRDVAEIPFDASDAITLIELRP